MKPSLRPRSFALAVALEGGLLCGAAFLPTAAKQRAPMRLEIACELSDASEATRKVELEVEEREPIEEVQSQIEPPELPTEEPKTPMAFEPPVPAKDDEAPERSFEDLRNPLEQHALDPLRPRSKALAQEIQPAAEPEDRPEEVAKATPEPTPSQAQARKPSLPKLLEGYNVPPVYPRRARKLEQEGVVHFEIATDASGRVIEARIALSSGSRLLDRAAQRAVRAWRYDRGPARFPWAVEFSLSPTDA